MTENKNSGETYSDKLKIFEKVLDEYNIHTGISRVGLNNEVFSILEMNNEQLSRMNAEQCGEAAFLIFSYSTYIQKEMNRQLVRLNWAENEFNLLLGKYGDGYGDTYTKFEVRKAKMTAHNSAAAALNNIIKHASARKTELYELSNKLTMIGRALLEYQKAKVYSKQ